MPDIHRLADKKDIIEFPCGKLYFRGDKDINDYPEAVVHAFATQSWDERMDRVFGEQKVIEVVPNNSSLVKVEENAS
jgi:hypothetical protein